MTTIRISIATDAVAIANVIRLSIIKLCEADHKNQPDILDPWLENKTSDSVSAWITESSHHCVTALNELKEIIGFGMLSEQGELLLLYIHPDQIGSGAGRAILLAIEQHARASGLKKVFLDSTDTALKFYESHGYRRNGSCNPRSDGLHCNSLSKTLDTQAHQNWYTQVTKT